MSLFIQDSSLHTKLHLPPARIEDDDDAALDEDDSSPDEHEQPPVKTLKGIGQAPAAKQRGPDRTREWKEYNLWSRSYHSDAEFVSFIRAARSFIRADLAELNERSGINSHARSIAI